MDHFTNRMFCMAMLLHLLSYTSNASQPSFIICAGNFRSCSTWQYNVTAHLAKGNWNAVNLGYLYNPEGVPAAQDSCVQVLKCHDRSNAFQKILCEGRGMALYSYRELSEMIESSAHIFDIDVFELHRRKEIERITANHDFWTRQPRVLVQRYEVITADMARAVRDIAKFLGLGVSDEEAAAIVQEYSLAQWGEQNKKHIRTTEQKLPGPWRTLNTPQAEEIREVVTQWDLANGYEPPSFSERKEDR